ncbi:hypothetical protein WA026_004330 [Henosepilachna vigintioctopunctata]|uniref:PDZ domain-containing protein n=1 Tax=Henosepilachna vigintioctopunctata TaxID=420089 RepID=A0AAW1V6A5_9CUCU
MEETSRDCTNGAFVTVVSIGNENYKEENTNATGDADFVTVLRIGEEKEESEDITEEVLVYRLPGERLGFGLKFEGGTKAAEHVKRLFIQSCAPDSPASRVLSSWGNLTEGDEVLVIDSRPVNSMTRIDCVKCLKDSNLIIKLLVRHFKRKVNEIEVNHLKSKVAEDLPQVISAEKKKVPPPPPPPVPPRKVPRKLFKLNQNGKSKHSDYQKNSDDTNPLPPVRHKHSDANNNGNKPKSSKIITNSPEFRMKRNNSDGSIGPPDAEFYVDLISQESLHSLSESDDTASTISTIIDRNGSSLPSTPRSTQKHLDISNFPDDEELFNIDSSGTISSEKLSASNVQEENNQLEDFEKDMIDVDIENRNEAGVIAEYITEDADELIESGYSSQGMIKTDTIEAHDENMNIFNLPRLVDFVPKICNELDQIKMMTLFLESERSEHCDFSIDIDRNTYNRSSFDPDIDIYSKWSVSPQLATIGEVEEESMNSESLNDGSLSVSLPTPVVIVHDTDRKEKDISEKTDIDEDENQDESIN